MFAFNEGGSVWESKNGTRVFLVQTAEKIPTRVVLTAKGPAGHGSLPRNDNAVLRLSRALVRLADADQPVRLTGTIAGPSNDRIGISLETVIDRTNFGITWNMELPSGGAVLENEVKLTADLELAKA